MQSELSKIIFKRLISNPKIFDESSGNNFNYARKIDNQLIGQDYDLKINIITPFFEFNNKNSKLLFESLNDDELIVKLPEDNQLFKEIEIYKKTNKYIIQNNRSGIDSIKSGILDQKAMKNRERMDKIIINLQTLLTDATLIIGDKTLEIKNSNYNLKYKEAFKILVDKVYYNLSILNNYKYKFEDIKGFYYSAKEGLSATNAQIEIFDYINARSKNSYRVTLKTIEEHFIKKSYGWSDNAILANIAGLVGCKKVELIYDGNLVNEEELVNSLKNSRLRSNIIVQIKQRISQEKTEKLRIFYKDFFENIPNSNEASDLAEEIKVGLNSLNIKLKNCKNQTNKFPFLENYKDQFDLISNISKINNDEIINNYSNVNKIIDIKKNLIDPLIKFVEGKQGEIYNDAFIFYKNNKDNFIFLKNEKLDQILQILNDPKCFLENKIPILKRIKNELEEEIISKKAEEINRVIEEFNNLKIKLHSVPQYIKSDKESQKRIIDIIDKKIIEIKNITTIHSIQAIYKDFEDKILPSLIEALDNVDNQKVIAIASLKFENKKIILESEEDVIEHIENYKKTILKEIKLGNKIKV